MADNNSQVRLYVLCNVKQAKEVKVWLESENALFKGEKIKSAVYRHADIDENRDLTLVPTAGILPNDTFIYDGFTMTLEKAARLASLKLNLTKLSKPTRDSVNGRFYATTILNPAPNTMSNTMTSTIPKTNGNNAGAGGRSSNKPAALNAMQKSFMTFLRMPSTYGVLEDANMNPDESQHLSFRTLTAEIPKRWTLYAPLVMLPPGSFSKQWQILLKNSFEGDRSFLWQEVLAALSTKEIKYTHIAMNKGIQLRNADEGENVIRAPSGDLRLLYGYFGPDIEVERFYLPSDSERIIGEEDFNEAFWVTTTQNGLVQTWAPRWTMFSRGNIKEKARVLRFEKAYTYTKEYKREQQRKARMPAQPAQNKLVSSAKRIEKGKGPQTPLMPQAAGSTMRDAMVVDSPSPCGRSKSPEVIELDSDTASLPSPRTVQTASSPFQPREIIDLAASPSPIQGSFDKKNTSAEPLKPVQSNSTRNRPRADSGLRIDGDAPFNRPLPNIPRPPSYSPIEETHSKAPLPPKQSRNPRQQFKTSGQPRLDENGNPRFQEVQLAIDMYAGIGYFTFSYLKLGYDVLAYELNAFSVEGLRRGAVENGFGCTVLRGENLEFLASEERRRRDDRDIRWTRGENGVYRHNIRRDMMGVIMPDEKPMVVKGTRIPTVCEGCANGTCAAQQRLANKEKKVVVTGGDAANEVADDNDDDLWDDSRLDAINQGVARPIISNAKNQIVIDDDNDDEPVRAESPLFVSQDGPAPNPRTNNNRNTHNPQPARGTPTPNTTSKATRPTSASKPAPSQASYPTLHSIEVTLQGQFTRPPQAIVYEANNTTAYQNFRDLSTLSSHGGGNPYRVRHVNLGFLPSTSDSWETSAQLVCSNNEGGYVHVHENVGVDDMAAHGEKVRRTFEGLCNSYYGDIPERKVDLVHTEMVKSYAPGVWHVVFDVKVGEKVSVSRDERRERERDADYYDGPFDEEGGLLSEYEDEDNWTFGEEN